jgi:D-beta-D-heptose 7-phosphate kinase / D-beta-D-heptose 1-phosphate adenosyltransferase
MNNFLPDFNSASIFVLGDLMLDTYVWGEVERISPEAPIPIVRVFRRSFQLGGSANVAANLAGLKCKVILAGVLGLDEPGQKLTSLLKEKNIQSKCIYAQQFPTITKTRIMGGHQQLLRIDEEQPDLLDGKVQSTLFETLTEYIHSINAVILSDYGKGIFNNNFAQQCIQLCLKHRIPVFVDPKNRHWSNYSGASCITPNIQEFNAVCQTMGLLDKNFEESGVKVREFFKLDKLLVTRGAQGMSLFSASDPPLNIPTKIKEVFDVSGAGDTVIATLAACAATGCSFIKAVEFSNIAAGIVVSKLGTYAISFAELQIALAELIDTQLVEQRKMIESPGYAMSIIEHWRLSGKRIVFTNGCFDLLHLGHVNLLKTAKKLGDKLVVGLNSDSSVRRLKGSQRPVLNEQDRFSVILALECVDIVIIFEDDTPLELIKKIKPDVLVKGADYTKAQVVGNDIIDSWGGRIELLELTENKSTSSIIEKIKR